MNRSKYLHILTDLFRIAMIISSFCKNSISDSSQGTSSILPSNGRSNRKFSRSSVEGVNLALPDTSSEPFSTLDYSFSRSTPLPRPHRFTTTKIGMKVAYSLLLCSAFPKLSSG
jgi:hypothetical protein